MTTCERKSFWNEKNGFVFRESSQSVCNGGINNKSYKYGTLESIFFKCPFALPIGQKLLIGGILRKIKSEIEKSLPTHERQVQYQSQGTSGEAASGLRLVLDLPWVRR